MKNADCQTVLILIFGMTLNTSRGVSMSLVGTAALLMWCEVPAGIEGDQGKWHSREHLPERMNVPGFLRGRRGLSRREGTANTFMLYELENLSVLTSPAYLERLDNPTPWSSKMMLVTTKLNRSTCQTIASWSRGAGGHLLTLRFNTLMPADAVRAWSEDRVAQLSACDAVTGAHFFTRVASASVRTKELDLRGRPDETTDYAILIEGYDPIALGYARTRLLPDSAFIENDTVQPMQLDEYRLVHIL
jgi:hypothetical protein